MYEIEKNIPIPERKAPDMEKYGFSKMELGDSIFIPCSEENKLNFFSPASYYGKRNNIKFTCRFIKEKPTGIRIWRIK